MGTKLYSNPEVAVRELLQNSIDTCMLRKAMEEKWENSYEPEITIRLKRNGTSTTIEVEDNGCGMDKGIVDKYYSKIGSSYYKSTEFYGLRYSLQSKFIPRSRFGIGILSCFMISDTIEVDTRHLTGNYTSSDPISLLIQGQDSIFWIQKGQKESPGTITKLVLRQSDNPVYSYNDQQFIELIKKLVPNPSFRINIATNSSSIHIDTSTFSLFSTINPADYQWQNREYIKLYGVTLNSTETGIRGSAKIAILAQDGCPVDNVELNARVVNVEGVNYELQRKLQLGENAIAEQIQSITISDDDAIHQHSASSLYNRSVSRLSLHGIEIPSTLFPHPLQLIPNQIRLSWPFSVILIIDVSEPLDLKLNSARTEVLASGEWDKCETELARQICHGIAKQVSPDYWKNLKSILEARSNNTNFNAGLNLVAI